MTKIYTLFLPHFFVNKENIINRLQELTGIVEYVGFDKLSGILDEKGKNTTFKKIKKIQKDLDGILVFGGILDHRLLSFGLPIIIVRAIMGVGDWQKGILHFYKGEKVLTAALSTIDVSKRISHARFKNLANKIKLISVLSTIKKTTLLCIQEPEILGNYDIYGMDYHTSLPKDYVDVYKENLEQLKLGISHVSINDLIAAKNGVDVIEARKVTDMWIREARKVEKETNRDEIMKAAILYLGMKSLLEKYSADGLTIRSLVPWSKNILDVTPCLANTELNKELKVGVCEGLVNSAITELFGLYIAERPSFIGDVIGIDTLNNTVIFAHCQSPVNPHGYDKVPYVIRSHALQKENRYFPKNYPEVGKSRSAAVNVFLPLNEIVTIVKVSVYHKKIAVSSGKTVSGKKLYKNFEDRLCRTKMVVQTNAKIFEKKYNTVTFGVHRNILFGDYRKTFKELACFIGYDLIEEDRDEST
jgi:hypothetical protein